MRRPETHPYCVNALKMSMKCMDVHCIVV